MSTEVHFRMAEAASQLALGDIERLILCMNIFYLGWLPAGKLALRRRRVANDAVMRGSTKAELGFMKKCCGIKQVSSESRSSVKEFLLELSMPAMITLMVTHGTRVYPVTREQQPAAPSILLCAQCIAECHSVSGALQNSGSFWNVGLEWQSA